MKTNCEDSYSATEKAMDKYRHSEQGKKAIKRYDQSEGGRAAKKRYFESEKGQAALLRYYLSEKAVTTRQQRQALTKLFRKADKYLKDNPEKTIEDYLQTLTTE